MICFGDLSVRRLVRQKRYIIIFLETSVADPDPFHFRLLDPTPALKKTQPNVREITYYKNFIIFYLKYIKNRN